MDGSHVDAFSICVPDRATVEGYSDERVNVGLENPLHMDLGLVG